MQVIDDLRASLKSQNRYTRYPFVVVFGALGLFCLWRTGLCLAAPAAASAWQASVTNPIPFEAALLAFACQAGALFAAAYVVKGAPPAAGRNAVASGCGLAAMPIVLWLR